MHYLITGDTHGDPIPRIRHLSYHEDRISLFILGDAGFDYYLNKRDIQLKERLAKEFPNITFYLVHGNHEARPQSLVGIITQYDDNVGGEVLLLPRFPQIRYLQDGFTYTIAGQRVLVLGGAYSVDKFYRLMKGWAWFKDEQLSQEEKESIEQKIIKSGGNFDFIFSHTCPLDWEPTDLFLQGIDQSAVDKSMERWLNHLKNDRIITYKWWLFGHYHDDRICEDEKFQMLFQDVINFPFY